MTKGEPSNYTKTPRELAETIVEETHWTSPDWTSGFDEQLKQIDSDQPAEVFFQIPGTSGQVHLRVEPSHEALAGELLLDIPLAGGFETQTAGGFANRLSAAHDAIATEQAAGYATAIADSSLVSRARIPSNWQRSKLEETLRSFDAIAESVTALHSDLEATLQSHMP